MRRHLLLAAVLLSSAVVSAGEPAAEVRRVMPAGQLPPDERLQPLRTLRDAYHPWQPAETKAEWERQAEQLRQRILVSNGLWPLPAKTPLQPVIHGTIDRGEYTVEKVFFQSLPGHYVTGHLYRPKPGKEKRPGVLCPHGHWPSGRFYDAGEQKAQQQIAAGAEQHALAARYPLQARMAQLARMGCVVFHYDMVGYADSRAIDHRSGFTDAAAGLHLQNTMGLQTWNSIRALDFLLSLDEVDAERIGVTGASGGGTQTFILCAIDPRPAVAFPAVMVSTNMQGGCVCENADYLRIGANNIAFAALFAPKPLAMSGADDWTIDIETKGLPELQHVYGLYHRRAFVFAKAFPKFQHNYNHVSREMMYEWFNRHLKLGLPEPIQEPVLDPIPLEDLSVFDAEHPAPADAASADELKTYLTERNARQFAELLPEDRHGVAKYRSVVGTAARIMLDDALPATDAPAKVERADETRSDSLAGAAATVERNLIRRTGTGEAIPALTIRPEKFSGTAAVWIDGRGKSALFDGKGAVIPAVGQLLDAGVAIIAPDVFGTGEYLTADSALPIRDINEQYHGYTFGYNRPLLSQRVRDVLTAIGFAHSLPGVKKVHLIGTREAGVWTLLARGLAGEHVGRTVVDLNGFGFQQVTAVGDPNFLPGALKYGGIGGLAALAAPHPLIAAATKGIDPEELQPLHHVYRAAGAEVELRDSPLTPEQAAAAVLATQP